MLNSSAMVYRHVGNALQGDDIRTGGGGDNSPAPEDPKKRPKKVCNRPAPAGGWGIYFVLFKETRMRGLSGV